MPKQQQTGGQNSNRNESEDLSISGLTIPSEDRLRKQLELMPLSYERIRR